MSAESESETSWAWAAVALAACVALVAPWPEGAVLPLGAWLPELAGAALLILCAARPELLGRGPSRGERLLGVALLGLILLAILQLLPLGGALETISPNSVRSRAPFVPAGRSAPSTLTLYPYKTRLVLCAWVTAAALLVAARGASRRQARWIAGALVVAATLQAVVGIGLHLAGSTLPWVDAHSPSRAHGSFRNANHFAGLLLMALPLSLALSGLANRRPGARVGAEVLWLVPAGLLALGILLSGSRGGALATLIAMAVFVVLLVPGGPKHISRGFLALTSGTVLLVGLAGVSSLADRFLGLTEGKLSVLRPSLWRTALGIWSDFPLLGAGVRSHEQLTPARREGSQLLNATHNDYLNLLADCGLAGALLGAVALGALVWVVRKRALALPSGPERTLFAAAAAGVLGLLSAVVVEFHLQISANLWACALACGLLLGAGSRRSAPRASRALRVALLLAGGLLAVDATRQAVAEWQVRAAQGGGAPAERVELCSSAARWNPELSEAPRQEGAAHMDARDYAAAAEAFGRACALEPRNPHHHLQLGRALLAQNQLDAGLDELERAAILAPTFPSLQLWIGAIRLRVHARHPNAKRIEQALRALRETLRWSPRSLPDVVSLVLGELRALHPSHFEQLLPAGDDALRRQASRLLADAGRVQASLDVLRPLVERKAAEAPDLERWAQVYLLRYDPWTARDAYVRAAAACATPEEREQLLARAWRSLASAYPQQGLQVLERAARRSPEPGAQRIWGEALLQVGLAEEALAPLRAAFAAGSPKSALSLGQAYLVLEQPSSAQRVWRDALASSLPVPIRTQISLQLGRALLAAGNKGEARSVFGSAFRHDPQSVELRQALDRIR